MTTVVTGATGHFGRLVVEALLTRGVAPGDIVATGRRVDTLDDLAARGVVVRTADYDDPASLDAAFAGAGKLLFVSGSEVGRRMQQHRNMVDAAVRAGVRHLVYTSGPRADISSTRKRVSALARNAVHGWPSSLLNEPGGATVAPAGASTCAMRSLVEVLPEEPVTPTTARPLSASSVTTLVARVDRAASTAAPEPSLSPAST